MIKFYPGKDYPFPQKHLSSPALTLDPGFITTGENSNESGWVIAGKVEGFLREWVEEFEATHPDYGILKGDFEECVEAESKEAFDHFWRHHEPISWDYWDVWQYHDPVFLDALIWH